MLATKSHHKTKNKKSHHPQTALAHSLSLEPLILPQRPKILHLIPSQLPFLPQSNLSSSFRFPIFPNWNPSTLQISKGNESAIDSAHYKPEQTWLPIHPQCHCVQCPPHHVWQQDYLLQWDHWNTINHTRNGSWIVR